MDDRPRVSVIVTAYNSEAFIGETLASIAAQNVPGVEVIVADDDSSDDTRGVARSFSNLDLRVVTGPNVGIGGNVARAAKHCAGDYVALIAGDDRWHADHLETAVNALDRQPDASLSFARSRRVDQHGRPLLSAASGRRPQARSGVTSSDQILRANFINPHSLVMRASAVRDIGGVDGSLALVEWDLMIRLVGWGPVIFIPTVTVDYRVHDRGLSSSPEFMLQGRIAVYRKHASPDEARRLVSLAHMRAAYVELWPTPTAESARRARGRLARAVHIWPSIARKRLFLTLLACAWSGPLYVTLARAGRRSTRKVRPYATKLIGRTA